ncbi:dUTP diphosphatase, partial [Crocinitomicaceae bacterium]|nr:dUTP diphosphatase [Crocinitomicaceae bacterium]
MSQVLKIKKLDTGVLLPDYSHAGDAALNIYASKDVTLEPMERVQVPTGIALEIPQGYSVFIWDRSS